MPNELLIKRSQVKGKPTLLAWGELAWSEITQRLYIGRLDGDIDEIAGVGGSNGASSNWNTISSNHMANAGDRLIADNTNADVVISLPEPIANGSEIEIINANGDYIVTLDFAGSKLDGLSTTSKSITLVGAFRYVKLLYLNSAIGWVQIPQSTLTIAAIYPSGMRLLLDAGSFQDRSGFGNNPTSVAGALPQVVTGLDEQKVWRFNGSGTQELQIPYFMGDTTAATLYCVFTVNSTSSYNLVRTVNTDDYWRFANDGNGYIGTFLNGRVNSYPAAMPSFGNHLVSIHASASTYEVILDKISKGLINAGYFSGDRFRIVTNDKPFNGDVALILVYPYLIDNTSLLHKEIVSTIKASYPSLPFT
jgi:hypothetical protein